VGIKLPKYRVRLFLSVDLAGSTAFKSQTPTSKWVKVFKEFYSSFLETFASNFLKYCHNNPSECLNFESEAPKLWKTVGDEVIFVNRVDSCFQVFAYVHAFRLTLEEYGKKLASVDDTRMLDVKGNGWIASFPSPNQTFELPNSDDEGEGFGLVSEAVEDSADKSPSKYDFLGKGIDYGFRIGKNSRPDLFTISPGLAWILCKANVNDEYEKFRFEFVFEGVSPLKGVLNGEKYPVIGINTERNSKRKRLNNLESQLSGFTAPKDKDLGGYLKEFVKFHEIEKPSLKVKPTDPAVRKPKFYAEKFKKEWQHEFDSQRAKDTNYGNSSTEGDATGDVDEQAVRDVTGELPD